MLKKVARSIKRLFDSSQHSAIAGQTNPQQQAVPAFVSQREMVRKLSTIPYWEDKINFTKIFDYSAEQGIWVQPADASEKRARPILSAPECPRVNYGCGGNIIGSSGFSVGNPCQELAG